MSEKRPTRRQCLSAVKEVVGDRAPAATTEIADVVAALFGGFAPEPAKVPRIARYVIASGPTIAASGSWGLVGSQLTEDQADAIVARSNAWEENLAGIRKAINYLGGDPLNPGWGPPSVDAARATLRSLLNEISSPEFGTGPEARP